MSKDQAMHDAVELWAETLVNKDKRIATLETRVKELEAQVDNYKAHHLVPASDLYEANTRIEELEGELAEANK